MLPPAPPPPPPPKSDATAASVRAPPPPPPLATPAPATQPALPVDRARPGVPIEAVEGLAMALGTAGDSGRRIAVVGARRNMGTTLAAISLARALAKQGRVVLLDLALESPNLSAIASEADAPGISELVVGSASFGQIITRDQLFARPRDHGRAGQSRRRHHHGFAAACHHAGGARPQLRLCRARCRRLAGDRAGAVCAACAARRAGRRRYRRARDRKRTRAAVRGRLPQCQRAGKRAAGPEEDDGRRAAA